MQKRTTSCRCSYKQRWRYRTEVRMRNTFTNVDKTESPVDAACWRSAGFGPDRHHEFALLVLEERARVTDMERSLQ
jgi:hypothetical protein